MSVLTSGAFLALAMRCAPGVHPDTSLDVGRVESGLNPYAIAEIIPKSERKPGSKGFITHLPEDIKEALSIVRSIEKKNRAYSVGLMQITSANFKRLNVNAEKLFSPCENLSAFETIITDCWLRAGTLKKSLSCYYSGSFETGQKIETSLNNTSYVQRIGYPSADKKYVVPGTKDDQLQENNTNVHSYEQKNPEFESWDILREYPRFPSRILKQQTEKSKDVINEDDKAS